MIKVFYSTKRFFDIPEVISQHRRQKILSCKNAEARTEMLRTAYVLAHGFAHFGIKEKDVIYGSGEYGKPFALNYPDIKFSITHSKDMTIIAFYEKEIGIDCEKNTRDIPKTILRRFFSDSEVAEFANCPVLLWVAKESHSKFTGYGLAKDIALSPMRYFDCEYSCENYCLQRLDIQNHTVVVCTEFSDVIEITEI